jgi:hypothetical protein
MKLISLKSTQGSYMFILYGNIVREHATFERQFVCKNIDINMVGVLCVQVGFVLANSVLFAYTV